MSDLKESSDVAPEIMSMSNSDVRIWTLRPLTPHSRSLSVM